MTLSLTQQEIDELWAQANHNTPQPPDTEPFEIFTQIPKQLGQGYARCIEVHPRLDLAIWDYEYQNNFLCKIPEWNHPLQFIVLLSGKVMDGYGGQVGEGYTCISGGGIQRQMTVDIFGTRYVGVNIHMSPDLLATFFPDEAGEIPQQLRFLAKGNDWQTLLYPETTTAIQGLAQQIINCPYQGITKQIYLQAKVLELMALQLAPVLSAQDRLQSSPRLKPETVARIHYAKDILLARLENPPSLWELAQIVGISNSTLKRGFPQLFGTTVFGYLTDRRIEYAERLLRQGNTTVAAVANQVGYSNQGHFAAAFQRRLGITPSKCLSGKKTLSGS